MNLFFTPWNIPSKFHWDGLARTICVASSCIRRDYIPGRTSSACWCSYSASFFLLLSPSPWYQQRRCSIAQVRPQLSLVLAESRLQIPDHIPRGMSSLRQACLASSVDMRNALVTMAWQVGGLACEGKSAVSSFLCCIQDGPGIYSWNIQQESEQDECSTIRFWLRWQIFKHVIEDVNTASLFVIKQNNFWLLLQSIVDAWLIMSRCYH